MLKNFNNVMNFKGNITNMSDTKSIYAACSKSCSGQGSPNLIQGHQGPPSATRNLFFLSRVTNLKFVILW